MIRKVLTGVLISSMLLSVGCAKPEPIKIGVSAQFTGKQAELGIQQRNAVIMAVDEINAKGGIDGRPLEVIVQDDHGTPEGARAGDKALAEQGVVCIIGHATSAMTLEGLPIAEQAGLIMMSPTASTSELSGKDDSFIRVIQSLVNRAEGLAGFIRKNSGIMELALIYDKANQAYSGDYRDHFIKKYTDEGGRVVAEEVFDSAAGTADFDSLLEHARSKGAKGLMMIVSDADAAYISQRARILGWEIPLFSSAWAQTDVLLKNGGEAVEGMILEQSFSMQSKAPRYLEFNTRFKERFGVEPSFSAALGYETALALEQGLKITKGERKGLKQALLKIKNLQGLTDRFSIDPYGDVIRPYYLGKIQGGKYVDVDSVSPQ